MGAMGSLGKLRNFQPQGAFSSDTGKFLLEVVEVRAGKVGGSYIYRCWHLNEDRHSFERATD